MKQTIAFSFLLLLFVSFGSIRFIEDNDYVSDQFTLLVNVDNEQGIDSVENARVRYLFLDDPYFQGATSSTSISSGDNHAKKIYTNLDGYSFASGEQYVRIYIYGDDGVRRIKHRPIYIG